MLGALAVLLVVAMIGGRYWSKPGWRRWDVPDPVLSPIRGGVRHARTGYVFPPALASLTIRRKLVLTADFVLVHYAEGSDNSGNLALDLILWPTGSGLEPQVRVAERTLRRRWSSVEPRHLILRLPAGAPDARAGWWHAVRRQGPAITGFAMVKRAGWMLEALAVAPDALGPQRLVRLQAALDAIVWPGRRGRLQSRTAAVSAS